MDRSVFVILTFVLLGNGCQKVPAEKVESPTSAPHAHNAEDHDHSAHQHTASSDSDVVANLAKLGAVDAASARAQLDCPVSSQALGSMGVPLKVHVAGRDVWVCCEHCRESLLAKPEEHLSKLREHPAPQVPKQP